MIYLLDSLGEGFFRVWHYGRVLEEDLTGLDIFQQRAEIRGCEPPSQEYW